MSKVTITVPEGIDVQVVYEQAGQVSTLVTTPTLTNYQPATAPQSHAAPSCPVHGPMLHKSGTNKSGKLYSGHFCTVAGCETTPVWDPK